MKSSGFAVVFLIAFTPLGFGCSTSKTTSPNNSSVTKQQEALPSPTTKPSESVAGMTNPASAGEIAGSSGSDPTVAQVAQNVEAYRGKRVRWFGQLMMLNPEGKLVRAVYLNKPALAAAKDAPTFVAVIKPRKKMDFFHLDAVEKSFQEFSRGWITGTVEGTHTITAEITSPTGEQSKVLQQVPLLRNASFEKERP
jgi:hypothetical protein